MYRCDSEIRSISMAIESTEFSMRLSCSVTPWSNGEATGFLSMRRAKARAMGTTKKIATIITKNSIATCSMVVRMP
jgi:hypothetical protein